MGGHDLTLTCDWLKDKNEDDDGEALIKCHDRQPREQPWLLRKKTVKWHQYLSREEYRTIGEMGVVVWTDGWLYMKEGNDFGRSIGRSRIAQFVSEIRRNTVDFSGSCRIEALESKPHCVTAVTHKSH